MGWKRSPPNRMDLEKAYWPWYHSKYKLKDYPRLSTFYDNLYMISILKKIGLGSDVGMRYKTIFTLSLTLAILFSSVTVLGQSEEPDLTISNFYVAPSPPMANEPVTIQMLVSNDGGAEATDVYVVLIADGEKIGEECMASFPAGSEKTIIFTWIPSEGTHSLTAIIDPDDKVDESIETNNEEIQKVSVPSAPGKAKAVNPRPYYMSFMILIVIIVVVVIVVVFIALIYLSRSRAPPPYPGPPPGQPPYYMGPPQHSQYQNPQYPGQYPGQPPQHP